MRILKISMSILILIIIVCLFAIGSVIYFVDPNKLKPILIEQVKNETGYDMVIEGKLTWSFYPYTSVKLEHVILTAPQQTTPFLNASDIRIATKLSALLQANEKLTGDVTVSQMKLRNVQAEKVSAHLGWENNVLSVSDIHASLYGGSLQGKVIGKSLPSQPQWQWNVQVDHVQVEALLQDLNGKNSKVKLEGIGHLAFQGEAQGKNHEEIVNTMHGVGELNLLNGRIDGIDVNYFVQTANALINKEDSSVQNSHQTVFDRMTGAIQFNYGIAETKNLLIMAPTFVIKARGDVVLNSGIIDFKLNVKPQLDKVKGNWVIPITLTGNLDHPTAQLDMIQIQKILAVMEIERIKERAIKQIQKHIPGKTGEFLQQLLK